MIKNLILVTIFFDSCINSLSFHSKAVAKWYSVLASHLGEHACWLHQKQDI